MTTMDGVGEEKRVGVPCLKASVWSLIGHHNGMKGGERNKENERRMLDVMMKNSLKYEI